MAQDKQLSRIEEKLNALLEKQGIAVADYEQSAAKAASRPPRELTPAEQQAIDNAPKHIEARHSGLSGIDEAKVMGASPPALQPTPDQGAPDLRKATSDEAKAAGLTDEEAKTAEATQVHGHQQAAADLPWHGYDEASSEDIIQRLRGLDVPARERALAYERGNKNRITITRVNWNSGAS